MTTNEIGGHRWDAEEYDRCCGVKPSMPHIESISQNRLPAAN
ncbi:hypothetical protein [Bradyrhizobium arachidis]|nr:hypothetical protein [Bradyrhizobium arachidis]